MDLCNRNDIRALLDRHGFRFSKSMGQNFLIQGWVPRDIADASGAGPGVGVLEVGPGIGPLTAELARRADKVVSVELDRALLPILAETLSPFPNARVVPGDILKTDLPALVEENFAGLTPIACANLPYNITSPALTALLAYRRFRTVTVMIQREVAERVCAAPGTADYGVLSVPPECFLPAPKVTSAVVRLTAQPAPQGVEDEAFYFRVVHAAFAQRRKTLVNSLGAALGAPYTKETAARAIRACGLAPDVRGERLSVADFARLSRAIRAEAEENR